MEKTYKINELSGGAWENAIAGVIARWNANENTRAKAVLNIRDDWAYAQELAEDFGLRFDINGEYVGM